MGERWPQVGLKPGSPMDTRPVYGVGREFSGCFVDAVFFSNNRARAVSLAAALAKFLVIKDSTGCVAM